MARVTLDASTGHVIEIEAAKDITREYEHAVDLEKSNDCEWSALEDKVAERV